MSQSVFITAGNFSRKMEVESEKMRAFFTICMEF